MNKKIITIIILLLASLYQTASFASCRNKQIQTQKKQDKNKLILSENWLHSYFTGLENKNSQQQEEYKKRHKKTLNETKKTLKRLIQKEDFLYIQVNALSDLAMIYYYENRIKDALIYAKKMIKIDNYRVQLNPCFSAEVFKLLGTNLENNTEAMPHLEEAIKILSSKKRKSKNMSETERYAFDEGKCRLEIAYRLFPQAIEAFDNNNKKEAKKIITETQKQLKKVIDLKDTAEDTNTPLIQNFIEASARLGITYENKYINKTAKAAKYFEQVINYIEEKKDLLNYNLYKKLYINSLYDFIINLKEKTTEKENKKLLEKIKHYENLWKEKQCDQFICAACSYYRDETISCDICNNAHYCSEECKNDHKETHQKECQSRACASCGTTQTQSRCGRCKKVFYCSKECQITDWPKHKTACKQ